MSSIDNASVQQPLPQPTQQPIYQPYPQQGYYVPQAAPISAFPTQQQLQPQPLGYPQQQVPYGAPIPPPQGYYVSSQQQQSYPQNPYGAPPVQDAQLAQQNEKYAYKNYLFKILLFSFFLKCNHSENRRYLGFILLWNIFTFLCVLLSFAIIILGIVLVIVSAVKNIPA